MDEFRLTRVSSHPLLLPLAESYWESENVFNPSVIYRDGLIRFWSRRATTTGKVWKIRA